MVTRWSEAQNRLLIRLVKERPCLWQKNNPDYQIKTTKDVNWEEIDTMLGTSGACRRFKSLRDDFTRYSKGTRKDYIYAQDMSFLRGEIGHRNSANLGTTTTTTPSHSLVMRKSQNLLTGDLTIELLDESDESVGLYEEVQEPVHQPAVMAHIINPSSAVVFPHQFNLFQETTVVSQDHYQEAPPHQESVKRARIETPSSGSVDLSTDWQAPVDNTSITREEFQFCKCLISTMSALPRARQRVLKSQIYQLVVDTCNNYEADTQQQQQHFN